MDRKRADANAFTWNYFSGRLFPTSSTINSTLSPTLRNKKLRAKSFKVFAPAPIVAAVSLVVVVAVEVVVAAFCGARCV